MNLARLLKFVFSGAVISYAVVHPFVMVIAHVMPVKSEAAGHLINPGFSAAILESFTFGMLPWSLGFAFLGGIGGYFYYKKRQAEDEKNIVVNELHDALGKINTLAGLIPICATCKKVRDDKGYWSHVESYINQNTGAILTHGICPDCLQKCLAKTDKY